MNLLDGIILTVVAMVVVFIVLGALWGVIELVHRFSAEPEILTKEMEVAPAVERDEQREKVAVLAALVMTYEAQPAKKFEVVDVKRVNRGGKADEKV